MLTALLLEIYHVCISLLRDTFFKQRGGNSSAVPVEGAAEELNGRVIAFLRKLGRGLLI
jgi:hypothetical protein